MWRNYCSRTSRAGRVLSSSRHIPKWYYYAPGAGSRRDDCQPTTFSYTGFTWSQAVDQSCARSESTTRVNWIAGPGAFSSKIMKRSLRSAVPLGQTDKPSCGSISPLTYLIRSPANRMFLDLGHVGQAFGTLKGLSDGRLQELLPTHGFPNESIPKISDSDPEDRGRNAGYPAPPAQIRTCALTHTALLPEGQKRTLRAGPEASPEADEPHPEADQDRAPRTMAR